MFIFKLIKALSSLLWLAVLAIVAAYFGRSYIDFGAGAIPLLEPPARQVPIMPAVAWTSVNQDIKEAVKSARERALAKAGKQLDEWHKTLMYRVDKDFLEWYFNYFNQQLVGFQYAYHAVHNYVVGSERSASESVVESIQQQFANRVLRPQVAQLELEQIARDAVEEFVQNLNQRLNEIPSRYKMPREEWERHLGSIAVMAASVEGDRSVPLTLKALSAGMGAASAGMMAKAFAPVVKGAVGKMAALLSTKAAGTAVGTAAIATATTTGAKVAGGIASGFLGPLIAVGIIGWDLFDHAKTVEENRPIMRQNIDDYLGQFQQQMLESDGTIGGVIHGIETAIYRGISRVEAG